MGSSVRFTPLQQGTANPLTGVSWVDKEGAYLGRLRPRIKLCAIPARARVSPEERAAPAPTTAAQDFAARFGDKVRPVDNELRVHAERSPKSALDLFGGVVTRTQRPCRASDQGLKTSLIGESRLSS